MKQKRHSSNGSTGRRIAVGALALGATVAVAVAQERAANGDSQRPVREITLNGDRNATATPDPALQGLPPTEYRPVSEGALPDESADLQLDGAVPPAPSPVAAEPAAPARNAETFTAPVSAPLPASGTAARPAETASSRASDDERPSEVANRADSADADRDSVPEGITRIETLPQDDPERYAAVERESQRIRAIENIDRQPEDDPYAPLGLRLGTVTLLPSIEQGMRWTSNAYSQPDARSSLLSETTLRLGARSDWARHAAELNAYGDFRRSLSGAKVSETEAGISGNLRIDFADDLRGIVEGGYTLSPESATSPSLVGDVANRATTQTLNGAVGLEKDVGKLRFSLRGSLERNIYGEADLVGGGTVSQSDRNSTLALATLRAGYEVSPAFIPFVEIEAGRRYYDETVDALGYRRSADRLGAKLGTEIDMGEKLRGELAAGFVSEDLDDSRLGAITGLAIDANLVWSPVRETTVTLSGSTTVEGATTSGDAGSLVHSASLSAERRIRANLTGNLTFGASLRDYAGSSATDLTLSAEAGLTWWLNRYAGLKGSVRHETFKAADSSRDYRTNSVYLGLTVQR
jgi:hypothetical protein